MDSLSDVVAAWLRASGRSGALVEVIPYALVIALGLLWYIRGIANDAYQDLRFQLRRRRFRSVGRNASREQARGLLRHYLGELGPAPLRERDCPQSFTAPPYFGRNPGR